MGCLERREIGYRHHLAVDVGAQTVHAAGEAGQEFVEQAEVIHHGQGGRMDGVTAKIPQEIGMLFKHHHVDARAREQKAEHHPGGAAAGDAALGW